MGENLEKQKEELRRQLSMGEFGNEVFSSSEKDKIDEKVDKEIVDEFINGFGSYKVTDFLAHVPSSILEKTEYSGYLYGISRIETESFYVLNSGQEKYPIIGFIANKNENIPDNLPFGIIIIREEDNRFICHTTKSDPVNIKPYDEQVNLFSRNSGLLETSWMFDKCSIIIGCGSVGSYIAMALARSGVGRFILCDTDILEIHNICRHQCGIDDLGRYKVDAVRDKILNINPKANVTVFRKMIQHIGLDTLAPFLGSNSIIIGTGDNRESSEFACDYLAIPTNTSFVATCCWTRAFAGEVIYWTLGKNLPCYHCALGDLEDVERTERDPNYWGSRHLSDSLKFEPGIAVDIDFVSIIALKVILDLINKDNTNYTPRVINYLRQYTWICNTNDINIGGMRAGMFSYPLQVTNNLNFRKKDGCKICGDKS